MFTTLILQFVVQVWAADYPRHFAILTDSTRPFCNEEAQCFVTQSRDGRKYQILFDVAPAKDKNVINAVKIVSLDGKTTEIYPLPQPKSVATNDMAPLFAVDINGDGYNDVAMQMGLGSKTGYIFYYWMYNPKSKKFVFTKDLIPALQPVGGKKITSLTTHSEYKVDGAFQLIETKSKQ